MSELIYKQFNLTRDKFIQEVEGVSAEIIDIQPKEFNNTIHWHAGHVLTVAEQFLFGQAFTLPENYKKLFGNGTKPADWNEEVPSPKELIEQLRSQLVRINEIPEAKLAEAFEEPVFGCETFGEMVNLALFHEGNHLGQVHSMKLLIERR